MATTISELFATYIPKETKVTPSEEYIEEKTPRKWSDTVLLMEQLPGKRTPVKEKPAKKSEEKENISVIEQPIQKPLEIDIENPRLAA
jgi:hypothetical protein